MQAGSFFPNRPYSTLFAMAADDLPLHFDMEDLTEKQRADHYDQNRLLAMLQVSLLTISKADDYVALFDEFTKAPWSEFLWRHHQLVTRMGFPTVPLDHIIYAPMETYYETLSAELPPADIVTFLMMSRSNEVIHRDKAAIERMLKLNSKFHFAENAPGFGIPVPDTLIAGQPLSEQAEVSDFFSKHGHQIILKMTGQPGARNVKAVTSIADAEDYLTAYRDTEPVLLQERLPLDRYVEWTADLLVTESEVEIDNVRRILVADGLWIGNLIPAENALSPMQEATLLNVGRYARAFGFGSSLGDNLGIDYFVGPNEEILVTEINPRWTAGLFPSQALKRLNGNSEDAVAYFELISLEDYGRFLDFVEEQGPGSGSEDYGVIHLGFSPYEMDSDGTPCVYCWLIVIGDFAKFRKEVSHHLGTATLRNGRLISP